MKKLTVILISLLFILAASTACTNTIPTSATTISPTTPVPAPAVAAPTTMPSPIAPRITVPPRTTTPPQRSLKVAAVTDKASYLPGEKVEITVSVTNITQEPIILDNFPSDVKIAGFDTIRVYNHGNQQVQLEPGESTTYIVVWDQIGYKYGSERVANGIISWEYFGGEGKPVNPSTYRIEAYVYFIKGSAPMLEGFGDLTRVTIEFPQGTMNKTIEVNQSQTVDGITMNLERIELNADRMKIYVFKTPVNIPSQPGQLQPQFLAGSADIQGTYRIDNDAPVDLGSFGYRIVEGQGVEYFWADLYPVPADARSLSIRITGFSTTAGSVVVDSDGPWEFTIPLE